MAFNIERLIAEIDADPAKAIAALRMFEAELDKAARDRTAHVKVEADDEPLKRVQASAEGASSKLLSLGTAVTGLQWGAMYSGATMVAGALSGLAGVAGGAVSALAPLGGLLATLPVGLGAVVGGIGATMLGLAGVTKGYSALTGLQNSAGKTADMMAQKQRALAMAHRSVSDALYSQKQAQQALADAQKEMAKAPAEAAQALSDQRRAVRSAVLNEAQAVDQLKQAQENLAAAQNKTANSGLVMTKAIDAFTGKSVEIGRISADAVEGADNESSAKLAVKQAELGVADARAASAEAQRKLSDMEKKGIKNSDIVVAARRRLRDAEHSSMLAARGVADAHYQVRQAQKDLTNTTAGATGALNTYNQAMKGLSPTAQRFVKFLKNEFVPSFKQVRFAAQEGLLPGVTKGLRSVMTMFPMLAKQARGFSRTVGEAFAGFMANWSKAGNQDRLSKTMSGLNGVLRRMFRVAVPLSDVLLRLTDAATPLTNRVLKGLTRQLKSLDAWMGGKKGQSVLDGFFGTKKKGDIGTVYKYTRLWAGVLKSLVGILGGVTTAAQPLATWMLESLNKWLGDINTNIHSINGQKSLTKFFNDQKPAIREFSGALGELVDVLFTSSKGGENSAFVKTMKAIRKDVIPALGELMTTLDKSDFGPEFAKFVGGLGDGLSRLVAQDGVLTLTLRALNSISDVLGELSKATSGKSSDLIAKAIAAWGIYKFGGKLLGKGKPGRGGRGGDVSGGLVGGLGKGVVNVRVVNWPRGFGGGRGGDDPFAPGNSQVPSGPGGRDDTRPRHPNRRQPGESRAHYLRRMGRQAGSSRGVPTAAALAFAGSTAIPGSDRTPTGLVADKMHLNLLSPKNGWKGALGNSTTQMGVGGDQIMGRQWALKNLAKQMGGVKITKGLGGMFTDYKKLDGVLASIINKDPKKASAVFERLKAAAKDAGIPVRALKTDLPGTANAILNAKGRIDAGAKSVETWKNFLTGANTVVVHHGRVVGEAGPKMDLFGNKVKGTGIRAKEAAGEIDTMAGRVRGLPPAKSTKITTPGLDEANRKLSYFASVWGGLTDQQVTLTLKGLDAHMQDRLDRLDATAHYSGGPVSKNKPYIVGEHRPELFVPTTSGRIMPKIDNLGGGGITYQQMQRLIKQMAAEQKQAVKIEQTFNERIDPKHVAAEVAWSLR